MSLTGDAATITTALATLDSVTGVTPAQMVKLIDLAISDCINSRGAVTSYSIAGRSVSANLQVLQSLRAHFKMLAEEEEADGSAFVVTQAEFVEDLEYDG